MVFEMKEQVITQQRFWFMLLTSNSLLQIGTLHKVLSQLLILLQWFAAYFPEHFYIGTPGIPGDYFSI